MEKIDEREHEGKSEKWMFEPLGHYYYLTTALAFDFPGLLAREFTLSASSRTAAGSTSRSTTEFHAALPASRSTARAETHGRLI
jgi:hypothetical protein